MKTRITGRQMGARAQAGLRKDLSLMYREMINEMTAVLQRYGTGPGGKVPRAQHDDVADDIGAIHRKYFLVGTSRKSFDENELAITPYAKILQRWYVYAVEGAVKVDRAWMRRSIPKDVYKWLAGTYKRKIQPDPEQESAAGANRHQEAENPYARKYGEDGEVYRARLVKDLHIVHDNPLAEVDPSRRWVPWTRWNDPNGYRLSDRLWRAEARAREKIDATLMRELRNNMGSLRLARLLEKMLLPDRARVKTNKPYGTTASFDAMRLARTEITRASNQAAYMSALINPYVNQIDIARSRNGDKSCPICPQHATIDGSGNRIRPPYDQNAAYVGPYHPHCMCRVLPVPSDSAATITQNIRALMEFDPSIQPAPSAATDLLVDALLGAGLASLWRSRDL